MLGLISLIIMSLDPGQFLYEFRRQTGVLRAVSMDDAYRNRAVGRITQGFATRSARVRMDFLPLGSPIGNQGPSLPT